MNRPNTALPAAPAPDRISTPCINVCAVSGMHGLCIGCGRSLKEIAGWSGFSPGERDAVMVELPQRLARIAQANPVDSNKTANGPA